LQSLGLGDVDTASDRDLVRAHYDAVINVGDVKAKDEHGKVVSGRGRYHIEYADDENPQNKTYTTRFPQAVNKLLQLGRQHKRVLVHCKMGTNRSVALILAAALTVGRFPDGEDIEAHAESIIEDIKRQKAGAVVWPWETLENATLRQVAIDYATAARQKPADPTKPPTRSKSPPSRRGGGSRTAAAAKTEKEPTARGRQQAQPQMQAQGERPAPAAGASASASGSIVPRRRHLAQVPAPALLLLLLLLLLLASVASSDYGQCQRSCRVALGNGFWLNESVTGRPGPHGSCACSNARGESLADLPPQRRLFPAEPAGFPHIEGGRAGVCGADRAFYETAAAAAEAGVKVVNCGPCGACSTTQDVGTYRNMSATLTKAATKCGILYLFGGERLARPCMRTLTTLSDGCAECWLANMGCTVTHCFKECVVKWQLPTNSENNPGASDGSESHAALNGCLLCDEKHCSPNFIRGCGANRRCGGAATDIGRPRESICPSVNIGF
jgi:hypothetical protein